MMLKNAENVVVVEAAGIRKPIGIARASDILLLGLLWELWEIISNSYLNDQMLIRWVLNKITHVVNLKLGSHRACNLPYRNMAFDHDIEGA